VRRLRMRLGRPLLVLVQGLGGSMVKGH
jgi:hypothetical protein